MNNKIIIITGAPGTGKSKISKSIIEKLDGFEIFSYDDIKEMFWDKYGFDGLLEKELVNKKSLAYFYKELETKMSKGISLIIEYPFCEKHKKELSKLVDSYSYKAVTVLLYGDTHTLFLRCQVRDGDDRHPGHLASQYNKEKNVLKYFVKTENDFKNEIESKNYDINIGKTYKINILDIDKKKLVQEIVNYFEDNQKINSRINTVKQHITVTLS